MAFVENKKNDNSIFSCGRLIPEFTKYRKETDSEDKTINNGYRVMIPYLESVQGGDTTRQALRIRQLYEDFEEKIRNLGATIERMDVEDEKSLKKFKLKVG